MIKNPISEILNRFRKEVIAIGLFSLVANVLMLTPTLYLLQVFDRVMISQSDLTLIAVSLIALFFFLAMGFAEWIRSRLLVRSGQRFDVLLNTRVFFACFKASVNKALPNPGQGLSDLLNLRQFLTGSTIFAFFDAPLAPLYILVSWMLHPFLGLLTIAFVLLLSLVAIITQWMTRDEHQLHLNAASRATNYLQAKIKNTEVVSAMGMTAKIYQRWFDMYQVQTTYAEGIQDHSQKSQSIIKFLQYTQQALVLGAGAVLVIRGELTIGAMIAASILATRALQPIQSVVSSWRTLMVAKLSYLRLNELLEHYAEAPGMVLRQPIEGAIECRNLSATAPGTSAPILSNINLVIGPGKLIAVLGPSGSGKSTLARCLLGIWPYVQGEVTLDGVEVQRLDRETLGPFFGYLPQEVELFEGTIAENIARFGEVDAQKVIHAAQTAGVHQMILRFPYGYDSPMGVAGSLLSGGQLQRIGLARAIYGDPKIIILDEPNANLDDAGEASLLKAMVELKQKGKTIVLISHRLGILNAADQILLLEDGKVSAFGERSEILPNLGLAQ